MKRSIVMLIPTNTWHLALEPSITTVHQADQVFFVERRRP